ncbi:Uncharacterized protein TCM_044700 [Theobroma cacao]|uniref:Uncharacterized protein n=1 Tax=Theobroma cacao TaxID=3641 RepID=A0A061FR62_THECC|nr:Uncharacterized protein TCM_044700 [Theobroma cacao]
MAADGPSNPPNHSFSVPPSLPMVAAPTPSPLEEGKLQPPPSHGFPQPIQTQIQPPTSPRFQKKSFLSIISKRKPPVVPPTRDPFVYKDRPAAAFFEDEIQTLAQPFKTSLVGKFSRMPKLLEVRSAFKGIGLAGAYEVRWLDYKHVLIHLSNEQDFNRIWTKQN